MVHMAGDRLNNGNLRPSSLEADLQSLATLYQKIIDILAPANLPGADEYVYPLTPVAQDEALAEQLNVYYVERGMVENELTSLEVLAKSRIDGSYVCYVVLAESFSVKFCLYLSELCAYQVYRQLNREITQQWRAMAGEFIKPLALVYLAQMQKIVFRDMEALQNSLLPFLKDEQQIHLVKQTIVLQSKTISLLNLLKTAYSR